MEVPEGDDVVEMSLFVLTGVAGFCCYAVSFALVQLERLDGNSAQYTALNVLAAALVLASMNDQFNLGSMLTQLTWIGVGLVGLVRRVRPAAEAEAPVRPAEAR